MRTVGRIAFVALVPVFIVWALLAAELLTRRSVPAATMAAPHPVSLRDDSTAIGPRTAVPRDEDDHVLADQSETDLYGNEVNDAVAEYGLDATGSMYEMHAPQVELPHLPSPKS